MMDNIYDNRECEDLRTPEEYIQDLQEENKSLTTENEKLRDFLTWMHLEKTYREFEENAVLKPDYDPETGEELPFWRWQI